MNRGYFACSSCVFFDPIVSEMDSLVPQGYCHRYAPQSDGFKRPLVSVNNFCGDHIRNDYPLKEMK